jgi:hypothetical protein
MVHSFTLMGITALASNGDAMFVSEISADAKTVTHRDAPSEYFYPAAKQYFDRCHRDQIEKQLTAMIKEKWQFYVTDTTPRWAEFIVEKPPFHCKGKDLGIARIVFSVATFFHVGSLANTSH